MRFFSRIEVWLLLVLAAGLAWWVVGRRGEKPEPSWVVRDAPEAEPVMELREATLERDYGNARLDLRLRVRNATPRPLPLRPPLVRLLAGSGREVAPFFLPAELPPELAAGADSEVKLRYWLEAADLKETLTLELPGASLVVKKPGAVDLDALPQGEAVRISSADWSGLPR
ncbi:MAG: hypothetical protein KDK99_03660 [Verrucomicrobiales bacterium]|nr:hypothetical protein [Verrucomicrobiales bacterium]